MDDGTTPLILAARHDLPDLVRHLIKAGVKVNSADNQGVCMCVICSFCFLGDRFELFPRFLKPLICVVIGKTALHWAASVNSLEVTKELLRNGAKKDAQDEKVS